MDDRDRIAELETELEALRARVELLSERGAGRPSLRRHTRCPVCDGRSVLRIDRIADRGHGGAVQPLAPLVDTSFWGIQEARGQFVVFVCRQCGLAEWYVADVTKIPTDRDGVTAIEPPTDPPLGGGYR